MPRPRKDRYVCALPQFAQFGPLAGDQMKRQKILMTIDEYECIRLIDYEGLDQKACAEQMKIARTTVQRIYAQARKTLSDCLVNAKPLHIEGGEYRMCDGQGKYCGGHGCRRHGPSV